MRAIIDISGIPMPSFEQPIEWGPEGEPPAEEPQQEEE